MSSPMTPADAARQACLQATYQRQVLGAIDGDKFTFTREELEEIVGDLDAAAAGIATLEARLKSQGGGVPDGAMAFLEELDAEIDRQLYDEDYVKGAREAGLDLPDDCEHHVVLREHHVRTLSKLAASPPPPEVKVAGWQPIETAPKDRLIDIWITHKDGSGVRWADCYYDHITNQWRTSRPGGKLVWVSGSAVSHWRECPPPPGQSPSPTPEE